MARAKTKSNFWYVLVLTAGGAKFVTNIEYYPHKVAEWKATGAPLELDKEQARQLALGLTVNGNMAVAVCNPYELENQPYCYDKGGFVWKWNDGEEEDDEQETQEA